MGSIEIGIIVAIVMIVGIIIYMKIKNKNDSTFNSTEIINTLSPKESSNISDIHKDEELIIHMDIISEEEIKDKNELLEITDRNILTYVNNFIPELMQIGNTVNNVIQVERAEKGEVLYRAIIPAGAKLTDSKAMKGAVRGFYSGTDGIKGHANFVEVNTKKGTAVATNTVASVMGLASMVVGQYYMTQINSELDVITSGISQIQDFQNNEYRSRVFSLMAHVKEIADFQTEIIENQELRSTKLYQLNSLEKECTQLLIQANLKLNSFLKETKVNYIEYEKTIENVQSWFEYQKSLLDVLYSISDLKYALYLGFMSREQCTALLTTFIQQVNDTQDKLTEWHQMITKRLGIDIDEIRRRRVGVDSAIHFIPGLFNNKFNFRPIEKKTAKMITAQVLGHQASTTSIKSELYNEDVQLISKDGKLYYLPSIL